MLNRHQGEPSPGRRSRKIIPVETPHDVDSDIIYKDGKITVRGETLEMLEELAALSGVSKKKAFNQIMRKIVKPGNPERIIVRQLEEHPELINDHNREYVEELRRKYRGEQ